MTHPVPKAGPGRSPGYHVVDFADVGSVDCPCGEARRAFGNVDAVPLTLHVTTIRRSARRHYHRRLTEIYYVLECEPGAYLEVDADRVELRPGMAVLIRPGTWHRAVGTLRVLIVVYPKFDPGDEWFDEEGEGDIEEEAVR